MNYKFFRMLVLFVSVAAGRLQANAVQLPADSAHFITEITATDCSKYILLQWKVADNTLADHYEIERMDADGLYHTIAIILCDNQKETDHYLYKDKITVRDLLLQYRIKAIIKEGNETLSSVAAVPVASVQQQLITIQYKAAGKIVTVDLPGNDAYVYRFYNIMGKMSKVTAANNRELEVNDLNNGSYFVEAFQPVTGKRYYGEFRKY